MRILPPLAGAIPDIWLQFGCVFAAKGMRRLQPVLVWSASPPQPTTHPAHASRTDAWGSIDAASGLSSPSNAYKISPRKVDIGSLIGSSALWLRCL